MTSSLHMAESRFCGAPDCETEDAVLTTRALDAPARMRHHCSCCHREGHYRPPGNSPMSIVSRSRRDRAAAAARRRLARPLSQLQLRVHVRGSSQTDGRGAPLPRGSSRDRAVGPTIDRPPAPGQLRRMPGAAREGLDSNRRDALGEMRRLRPRPASDDRRARVTRAFRPVPAPYCARGPRRYR